MPCQLQRWEVDVERQIAREWNEHVIAVELDNLRELVLRHKDLIANNIKDSDNLTDTELEKHEDVLLMDRIAIRQVAHRKEDLDRLKKRWKSGKKLAAVNSADPRFPLEPQLGFDPDRY